MHGAPVHRHVPLDRHGHVISSLSSPMSDWQIMTAGASSESPIVFYALDDAYISRLRCLIKTIIYRAKFFP